MTSLSDMMRQATTLPATAETKTRTKTQLSLEEIFEEEPVSLTEFVTGKQFMNSPRLGPIQYAAVQHAERIYYKELYPLMAEVMHPYWAEPVRMTNFITLEWGKGAGKDHCVRVMSMRVAYLLLCLRSPQDYFGLPSQDSIHLLNVASSASQAKRAFFKPMVEVAKKGWFKDRCEPLVNSINYDKNIEAVSGHSETESQEGNNLILGVADEVDAFKSREFARSTGGKEPTNTVEGILDMLRTSASTRFPETFKNVVISYPRYEGSPIQRLRRAAEREIERKGEDSANYASGPLCTWDVNPRYDRYERIVVQGSERPVPNVPGIVNDYELDSAMAKAKYECLPSRAISPYFRNTVAVESCFKKRPTPLKVTGYHLQNGTYVPDYEYDSSLRPIKGARYAMHGDLAINGDMAGIAMAHVVRQAEYESPTTNELGEEVLFRENRPFVKVDFVINFAANAGLNPPREIQIWWARALVFDLIKRGFNVRSCSFDGYQSTDTLQLLSARGIVSKRVSTDLSEDPWKTLKDLFYEGRLDATWDEDVLNEILSLDRRPNGKVDHPPLGKKDSADALACAVFGAVQLGGEESGEVASYAPAEFDVGTTLEMPVGLMGGMPLGPTSGFDESFARGRREVRDVW